jgi:fatty acid desaturase
MFNDAFYKWRCADRKTIGTWCVHALLVAAMLTWLQHAGIAWWYYLLVITWPALSLTMIRSLYEHRAADHPKHRTAINEAGVVMRLLFLNNNYHIVHHEHPSLPWYLLHKEYWRHREAYAARNGGYVVKGGYWELFRRFSWRQTDACVHPRHRHEMRAGAELARSHSVASSRRPHDCSQTSIG